ncbi:MAG: PAQR family membrane homeostasis protein TrhA [Planctomycetota bacterium]|jgi:channel protein (hemolysin III family)
MDPAAPACAGLASLLAGTPILGIPGFADPVNSLTHLLGAGVFLLLSWPLLRRGRGDVGRTVSLAIFAVACVLVLALSGVYHLLDPPGAGRAVLRRLDHAAIFVLIAGTFTPVHWIVFRGIWRWGVLAFIWAAAVTGIVLKTIFFDGVPAWLGVTLYVALGWTGIVGAIRLIRTFGWPLVTPLLLGAVGYTLGAGCLGLLSLLGDPMVIPGVVGRHELFHLCVLAGIAFHWQFVHRIADGRTVIGASESRSPWAVRPVLPARKLPAAS